MITLFVLLLVLTYTYQRKAISETIYYNVSFDATLEGNFQSEEDMSKGTSYLDLKDYKGALQFFGELIKNNPECHACILNKCITLFFMKDFEEALGVVNPLIRNIEKSTEKVYVEGRFWKARIFLELDRGNGAMLLFKQVLDSFDSSDGSVEFQKKEYLYWSYAFLGNINFYDFHKAKKYFTKAIEMDSSKSFSYLHRGDMYVEHGDTIRGERDLKKAVKLDPNNVVNLAGISTFYFERKKVEVGRKYVNDCLEVDPKHAPCWFNLGLSYYREKNYNEAIKHFEEAARNNDDYHPPYSLLGTIYRERNDLIRAKDCWSRVVELFPGHPEAKWIVMTIDRELEGKGIDTNTIGKCIDFEAKKEKIQESFVEVEVDEVGIEKTSSDGFNRLKEFITFSFMKEHYDGLVEKEKKIIEKIGKYL